MLSQVKEVVRGKTVIVKDKEKLNHEGEESFNILQFVTPTERGNHADDYVRELRDNDRF